MNRRGDGRSGESPGTGFDSVAHPYDAARPRYPAEVFDALGS